MVNRLSGFDVSDLHRGIVKKVVRYALNAQNLIGFWSSSDVNKIAIRLTT